MARYSMEEALRISNEVFDAGGPAEGFLRAKCNWEHMSRTAVICSWGDPREWEQVQEEARARLSAKGADDEQA